MEKIRIAGLLEKYWQAETTVDEEKVLAAYFRQPVIPPEWEAYRQLFTYYEAESRLGVGEDFDKKVLQRIGMSETVAGSGTVMRPLIRRAPWWAAAAVILLSLGAALLMDRPNPHDRPGTPSSTEISATTIKDTYDDPQEALAAIRKALFKASSKINQGKTITKKEMGRMKDSWQMAVNY